MQSCSQISQPAKASPKESTAMFSLINCTIWVCERKQKNIWGGNMNHVTVCFSLNHPDWLIISLNPKAADTANPLGITLLSVLQTASPVSTAHCCLICFVSPPFLDSLLCFPSLLSGKWGWRGWGDSGISNTFKFQNGMVTDSGYLVGEIFIFFGGGYRNLTSNRQSFQACQVWNFMFNWGKCNFIWL